MIALLMCRRTVKISALEHDGTFLWYLALRRFLNANLLQQHLGRRAKWRDQR